MQELDVVTVPLEGIHLIEASAGTGKTYNITRLFVRALLERKLDVRRILVVTFTEAATDELRGRIGRYLGELERRWQAGQPADTFEKALFKRPDADQARVLLACAAQDMDLAEIHTIHGFCARVLREQAFHGGEPFDQEVLTDGDSLVLEAVRDLYRRAAVEPPLHAFLHARWKTPERCARDLGRKAVEHHGTVRGAMADGADGRPASADPALPRQALEALRQALKDDENNGGLSPTGQRFKVFADQLESWIGRYYGKGAEQGMEGVLRRLRESDRLPKPGSSRHYRKLYEAGQPLAELEALVAKAEHLPLADCAAWIRDRVDALRRQRNVIDFSAMIQRVHAALAGDQADASLRGALARRYPVMLVDEFQDTDPAQFEIFHSLAKQDRRNALFMIGDPKQAIYRFRGGDVHTYLRAREGADHAWTLRGNWRSTAGMVEACNAIFGAREDVFGQVPISYHRVHACKPEAQLGRLEDGKLADAAAVVPVLAVAEGKNRLPAAEQRERASAWCAREARRLLESASIEVGGTRRRLSGKDIAFLVRSHAQVEQVMQALREEGLTAAPARSRKSVFATAQAMQLRLFLRGVLRLEQEADFLTALATPWVGLTPACILELKADSEAWQAWQDRFARWRERWQRGAVLAMLHEAFFAHHRLSRDTTHRSVTNLFHLAELMQRTALRHPAPEDQLAWLEAAIADPGEEAEGAELRLERDDTVISVLTMHAAKGLEYPVVFLPFVDGSESLSTDRVVRVPGANGLELGLDADKEVEEREKQEAREEAMRLFYVAMTRSIYRCYLPWLGDASSNAMLTTALGGPAAPRQLEDLPAATKGSLRVLGPGEAAALHGPGKTAHRDAECRRADPARLAARPFTGTIEVSGGTFSFSALVRDMPEPGEPSRPERDDDEPGLAQAAAALPLRFRMPRGAATGDLLHALLEHASFAQPAWGALMASRGLGAGLDGRDREALAAWMDEVLDTPLPLPGAAVRLRELAPDRCLREVEFYFPAQAATSRIEAALCRWRGGGAVRLPRRRLDGMMRGFIDLVFQVGERYWVADYKSTWLGARLVDYSAEAITQSMTQHLYDLQGLIYTLALHRLLRRRLPDYDPDRHLGGMVFLYLRGMAPEAGTGVAVHPVPAGTVEEWDRMFEAGGAA